MDLLVAFILSFIFLWGAIDILRGIFSIIAQAWKSHKYFTKKQQDEIIDRYIKRIQLHQCGYCGCDPCKCAEGF